MSNSHSATDVGKCARFAQNGYAIDAHVGPAATRRCAVAVAADASPPVSRAFDLSCAVFDLSAPTPPPNNALRESASRCSAPMLFSTDDHTSLDVTVKSASRSPCSPPVSTQTDCFNVCEKGKGDVRGIERTDGTGRDGREDMRRESRALRAGLEADPRTTGSQRIGS
jgi:hypothetical protein